MRIRRTTSLQMESRARKPTKKQLPSVSVSLVIFILRSVTFPTEILLQVSAVIIKRRLYTHESKLKEFFLFSSIISRRQRIVSVFSSIFLSISRLLRPGTKRRTLSFFCSCLIIFSSKKKNYVSAFSWNLSEKPRNKAAIFKLQILFIERSAVIDEGDYQLCKQVLFHPRFSCVSHKYLRISKSRQQSSRITFLCQKFAVINEEGDYS